MGDRLRFFLNRISERLWVRPLAMCVLSTAIVFLAKTVDNPEIGQLVPAITPDSIETLLSHYFRKHVGDRHLCCRIDGLRLCFGQQYRNAALFFSGHLRRRFPERSLDLYWRLHLQHRRAYRLKEWLLR